MTTYTSTTDHAADIRQTLKARYGWTSRDVSVRAESYSMGSSIHVRIKNPAVAIEPVRAIAMQSEDISRDERTGEILSGGNRFVYVSYTADALTALAAPHVDAVRRAKQDLEHSSDHTLIPIDGTEFLLGKGHSGYGLAIWDRNTHRAEVMDEHGAAQYVAIGSHNNS